MALKGLEKLYGQKFDLVICDFEMPEMSGLEFAEEIVNQGVYLGFPLLCVLQTHQLRGHLEQLQEIISNSFWVEKSNKALNLRNLIDEIFNNS